MNTTKLDSESSTAPVPPSELAIRTSPLAGATLLVLLTAGLLSCGWLAMQGKIEALPSKLSTNAVLEGDVTHRIAKELSAASLPQYAANLERGASWLLFQDTGPRVRQGCPGWLFLADELKLHRRAQSNADAKAQAVIGLRQQLARRGIELLVAVIPDKSRIAAAQRCTLRRPGALQARIVDFTWVLQKAGVATIDLTPVMQPLGAQAYLQTDTHWSESGAQSAARAIGQRTRALGITPTPQKAFDVSHAPAAPRPGDLVRLSGIDWLPLSLQPAIEVVAQTQVKERIEAPASGSDSLDDLFGDDNLPNTALIGTSFSRNSNFAGFLQLALGAPVGNFAKDGGEFSGAAKAYFDSPAFEQTPPRLVIWEIPERDLQTPYADDIGID